MRRICYPKCTTKYRLYWRCWGQNRWPLGDEVLRGTIRPRLLPCIRLCVQGRDIEKLYIDKLALRFSVIALLLHRAPGASLRDSAPIRRRDQVCAGRCACIPLGRNDTTLAQALSKKGTRAARKQDPLRLRTLPGFGPSIVRGVHFRTEDVRR